MFQKSLPSGIVSEDWKNSQKGSKSDPVITGQCH